MVTVYGKYILCFRVIMKHIYVCVYEREQHQAKTRQGKRGCALPCAVLSVWGWGGLYYTEITFVVKKNLFRLSRKIVRIKHHIVLITVPFIVPLPASTDSPSQTAERQWRGKIIMFAGKDRKWKQWVKKLHVEILKEWIPSLWHQHSTTRIKTRKQEDSEQNCKEEYWMRWKDWSRFRVKEIPTQTTTTTLGEKGLLNMVLTLIGKDSYVRGKTEDDTEEKA